MSTVEIRHDQMSSRPLPERIPLLFIDGVRTYGMYDMEQTGNPPMFRLHMGAAVIMETDRQPDRVQYDDGLTGYIWRDVEIKR